MNLENGRPADTAGRQERELRAYDFLDGLGVPFRRVDHPAAMTMEDCEEIDKTLGAVMCKNLFLCNRQKTDFYLLLMPGDKKFITKEFSRQLGVSRLSFADEGSMEGLLGLSPGAVTVLGLMNDREKRVQLVIDRAVMESPWLGCHPCVNTSSLRIAMGDFKDRVLPALGHQPILVDLPEQEVTAS